MSNSSPSLLAAAAIMRERSGPVSSPSSASLASPDGRRCRVAGFMRRGPDAVPDGGCHPVSCDPRTRFPDLRIGRGKEVAAALPWQEMPTRVEIRPDGPKNLGHDDAAHCRRLFPY